MNKKNIKQFLITGAFLIYSIFVIASDGFLVQKKSGRSITIPFQDVKALNIKNIGMIEGSIDSTHNGIVIFSYELYSVVPTTGLSRRGKEKIIYINEVTDTTIFISVNDILKIKYDKNPQFTYRQKRLRKNLGYAASAAFVLSSYLISGKKPSVFILPVTGTGIAIFGLQYLLQPIRTLRISKNKVILKDQE